MKNNARIVVDSNDQVYLEIHYPKKHKIYFAINEFGLKKDNVIALSDYFEVNLTK
jgi:ubiquinone biosynthesis protein Coq4